MGLYPHGGGRPKSRTGASDYNGTCLHTFKRQTRPIALCRLQGKAVFWALKEKRFRAPFYRFQELNLRIAVNFPYPGPKIPNWFWAMPFFHCPTKAGQFLGTFPVVF